jgi:transposase
MLDARSESRIEVLQEACALLQDEVLRLSSMVRMLALENARLQGRELTQAELDELDSAPRCETPKASDQQRSERKKAKEKPRRGHGPRPQPDLPKEERLFELPAEERTCTVCQGELREMGVTEDSEEITVVERTYKLVLNRRRKYRCRCNANVVTAAGPVKLIPGGRYSPEFAVSVAIDKYADHLPLERQATRMARCGLAVNSAALFDQIAALADVLAPTYRALLEQLLAGPVLHVDETGWLLAPNGKPVGRKRHRKKRWTATVWGLCSEQYAYYALLDSKSTEAGRSLLESYGGIVVADGYQVYEILSGENSQTQHFTLVNCWAHTLRKFRDLESHEPRCKIILEWIRELYEIEREIDGPFPGDRDTCERRRDLRRRRSQPILDEIKEWAFQQGGLRRSDFGKALNYMMKRWEQLTRFVDDGRIPLDNNRVERALRGPVLGRRNHFCSRSERGATTTAVLYSLVETARLNGIDPARYLLDATQAALQQPGAVTLP